jgi:hypothetical protein
MSAHPRDEIRAILDMPVLKQNVRAKIRAIIPKLDTGWQLELAFNCVEHIVWICEEVTRGNPQFRVAIASARRILQQPAKLEDFNRCWMDIYVLQNDWFHARTPQLHMASDAAFCVERMMRLCLRKADVQPTSHNTTFTEAVDFIVDTCSRAAGKYAAGIDWDSPDKTRKALAHKKGREASTKESRWQLSHILELIGMESESI